MQGCPAGGRGRGCRALSGFTQQDGALLLPLPSPLSPSQLPPEGAVSRCWEIVSLIHSVASLSFLPERMSGLAGYTLCPGWRCRHEPVWQPPDSMAHGGETGRSTWPVSVPSACPPLGLQVAAASPESTGSFKAL